MKGLLVLGFGLASVAPFAFRAGHFTGGDPAEGERQTMNTMIRSPLAGLLLACLGLTVCACVLALPQHAVAILTMAGLGLVGVTGTVTYRCPAVVKGTTTVPTAGQVANYVCADVAMGDAATITNVTHNLSGVSTDGSDGSPMYSISCLVVGATPVGRGVTVSFTTNALQLSNLTTAAGNGATYRVEMWRHSLISDFVK